MQIAYPVFFTQTENCVLIEVPDLEILTEGKDMEDAIFMARDAVKLLLGVMKEDGKEIPVPSNISELNVNNGTFSKEGKTTVVLLNIDSSCGLDAYAVVKENTKYNERGQATVSKSDEWIDETEWDDLFKNIKRQING